MAEVENAAPQAPAPVTPVAETPAAATNAAPAAPAAPTPEPAKPDTPEARDAALTADLAAVWDKQTTGAERGADGRFVSKSGEPKDGKPVEPNSADQPQAATPEPAKTPAITAPLSWSADAKAYWEKLPPEAQTYIAQREGEAHKQITSQGERLKTYEPIDGVLSHYKDDFSRRGVQPAQAVSLLLEAQRQLDANPLNGLVQIGLTYGIDLRPLLNGVPPQQLPQADPRVQALEQTVSQLKQHLSTREQQESEQVVSIAQAQVTEFSKDKPYFEEARPLMAAMLSNGQATTLDDAYDMAIHANKSIRERILADQRKTEEAKRTEEAKARAEEARKSGKVNVKSGTATPTPKTIDETIEELARRAYG